MGNEVIAGGAEAAGRKCVLIVGMHRSGTSMTSGILVQAGLMAPASLMPANEFNESGYWESTVFCRLNDKLLNAVRSAWHDPLPIDRAFFHSALATEMVGYISQNLGTEFPEPGPVTVVKDPRIARLLPLWVRALRDRGIAPAVVIPFRNPLNVAASLHRRDGLSLAHSQALWLRYVLDAVEYSAGLPRAFVSYEASLRDWRASLRRMSADIDVPLHLSAENEAALDGFVSRGHVHHDADAARLDSDPEISPWVRDAYAALSAQASGEDGGEEALAAIARAVAAADRLHAPIMRERHAQAEEARDAVERLRQTQDRMEKVFRSECESKDNQLRRALAERDEARAHARELRAALSRLDSEVVQLQRILMATEVDLEAARTARLAVAKALGRSIRVLLTGKAGDGPLRPKAVAKLARQAKALGVIDADWYLAAYNDVATAGVDPAAHYILHGAAEGREPLDVSAV